MRATIIFMTFCILGLGQVNIALARGNADMGKEKSKTCAMCHGPQGISSNPAYPNLAGQKEAYIIKAIKDFRDGNRTDKMMSRMAKPLSDEDISNLAAYFSNLK